jgi:hypothetical protein
MEGDLKGPRQVEHLIPFFQTLSRSHLNAKAPVLRRSRVVCEILKCAEFYDEIQWRHGRSVLAFYHPLKAVVLWHNGNHAEDRASQLSAGVLSPWHSCILTPARGAALSTYMILNSCHDIYMSYRLSTARVQETPTKPSLSPQEVWAGQLPGQLPAPNGMPAIPGPAASLVRQPALGVLQGGLAGISGAQQAIRSGAQPLQGVSSNLLHLHARQQPHQTQQ